MNCIFILLPCKCSAIQVLSERNAATVHYPPYLLITVCERPCFSLTFGYSLLPVTEACLQSMLCGKSSRAVPIEIIPFRAGTKEIHVLILPGLIFLARTSPLTNVVCECYILEPADEKLCKYASMSRTVTL